jgi:hypothetical protein
MYKSEVQKQLEEAARVIALGLLNAEWAEKLIASNERVAKSNEYYAKWSKRLSIGLILTTLVVGLLQAGVLAWQTFVSHQ